MDKAKRELTMAYLAGLYDGDGSFSLCKSCPIKAGSSSRYIPLIQMGNANREILELIKLEYGGHICTQEAHTANDGHFRNTTHTLKFTNGPVCLSFLRDVSPYLFIKKERATFLMDYINKNPHMHTKLDAETVLKRENAYISMKLFNEKRDVSSKFSLRYSRKNSNDDVFWQYVAGIMDTDGSFSIRRDKRGYKSHVYSPIILLSMIDSKAIQYIYNNCLYGTIFLVKAKAAQQGFCYRYSIHSKKQCIEFINKIIDHLFIKQEAARTLLAFCKGTAAVKHRRSGVPEDELLFRDNCYTRLVELNKNGVSKLSLIDLKPVTGDADGNKGQAVNNVQPESNKRERLPEEVVCAIPNSVRKTES